MGTKVSAFPSMGVGLDPADLFYYVDVSAGASGSKKITILNTLATLGQIPQVYIATAFGMVGDGVTDNSAAFQALIDLVSAAGGGTIYFPPGIYLVAGPLQDTSGANAQIVLPSIHESFPFVVINLVGATPPPVQLWIPSPPLTGNIHSILKSNLTGGTGTASFIAGKVPTTPAFSYSNTVVVNVTNLVFQMPPNPSISCLNLRDETGNYAEHVLIYTGSFNFDNIVEPTHANTYGITMPTVSHTPRNYLNGVNVYGYYTGLRNGELTEGSCAMWSCKVAYELPAAYHPSLFHLMASYFCAKTIVPTGDGAAYLKVGMLDIERKNPLGGSGQAWQTTIFDLDDTFDRVHGKADYVSVTAGIGNDHTFTKNGGANFTATDLV